MSILFCTVYGNNVNRRVWIVIARETVWPVKLKNFTRWSFTEKSLLIHNIIYSLHLSIVTIVFFLTLFPSLGLNPESWIAFNCHISESLLLQNSSPAFLLSFMKLPFWSRQARYFLECSSIWVYLMFPHDEIQVIRLLSEHYKKWFCILLMVSYPDAHDICVPLLNDINFDGLLLCDIGTTFCPCNQ